MTATEVMQLLESYGDANTKKTFMKHGAKEPLFGVRIGDLKKILAKTKKNHELSLALYQTGNSDAMYLAGLMADEKKITEAQLDEWVSKAYWSYLNEFAVPWVAAETAFGFDIGMKWLQSPDEGIACAGWATLSSYAAVTPDEKLDTAAYSALLDKIGQEIHQAPNRVRYTMNSFIISIGTFIPALTGKCVEIAQQIGTVTVNMDGTACKVPSAQDYIQKNKDSGRIGKKKKMARC